MDIIVPSKPPAPKPPIWLGSSKRDLCAQTGQRHESTKVLSGFGDASVLEVIESQAGSEIAKELAQEKERPRS